MSDEQNPANSGETSQEGATAGAAGTTETQGQEQTPPAAVKTYSQEAYSALQSRADKAAAEAKAAREAADRAIEDANRARREAELANLKPEEREAMLKVHAIEDRERRLQIAEREQEETAKQLAVTAFRMNAGLSADQVAELEGINDVNEMRARAAEMKAENLERELEATRTGAAQQQTQQAPAQQVPAAMKGDPPPSGGSGGSGGSYDAKKFAKSGDIAGALRAQREAGKVEYQTVPFGRR